MFARQAEIWAYMRRVADKHDVVRHFRYGSEVESLEYDDEAGRWRGLTVNGDLYTPKAVISGVRALHVPSYPELPGLDSFEGPAFHSAAWGHSYDLAGTRGPVLGPTSSALP